MKMTERPPTPTYDPSRLFDALLRTMHLDSDEALCAALRIPPYLVSSIRRGEALMAPSLLIRINELSGINIRTLRSWMGDRRSEYRLGEDSRHAAVPPADDRVRRRYFVESVDPGLPNYVQWT
ncbi:hypothetical protein ACFQUU_01495 [Herbaspirillum sp. GCM10030257]|uniref:hypothetical protein n=1 Tax=Herbaspirillum sp. GCM10030257 TaxID=3273393 RepID=UPI0036165748